MSNSYRRNCWDFRSSDGRSSGPRPGNSGGSSVTSKRPREPSPAPWSSPNLSYKRNIFEAGANDGSVTDSHEEDDNPLPYLRNRIFHFNNAVFGKKRSLGMKLSANEYKDEIMEKIEGHRVVIISGNTGCGKTTQVPQLLIDRAVELRRPCNVVVTQPRRLAAVSVARRVCEERCWELGTVVGYDIGMDEMVSEDTLVTYMTPGVLLQRLIHCKSLKTWTHIIVDEVHERDLHTDLLLLFIKKILMEDILGNERQVKLILMSATVNTNDFSEYYDITQRDDQNRATPVIKIPTTEKYKIEDYYLDNLVSSKELDKYYALVDLERADLIPKMYTLAVRKIVNLDQEETIIIDPQIRNGRNRKVMVKKERGSVLVFLPGLMEIKTLEKLLNEENRKQAESTQCNDANPYQWDVVLHHSSTTNEEQMKVFETPEPYCRKIILTTDIAESSITIPHIVYVIDFCLTKSNFVDTRTNYNCRRLCWASVSQCIQRAGRSGRVRDGKVYRMIPRKTWELGLAQDAKSEMSRSALEYVVLKFKILDMGSPQILSLALDPRPPSAIERAISNLKEVGALTVMTTVNKRLVYSAFDGDVTFMGNIMSELPLSPRCTRLVMLGHCFGVMKEAIIIAAGLSGKSPFATPCNQHEDLDLYLQKLNWANELYSDCLVILHAYRAWYSMFGETEENPGLMNCTSEEKNWAREQNIRVTKMRYIRSMVQDIEKILKDKKLVSYKLPVVYSMENPLPEEIVLMLKIAIAGAFYPNYFRRPSVDLTNYEKNLSKQVCGNDLFSTVCFTGFPTRHNGKLYAKHVANYLSHGLSVPYIKFEGQMVLAMFDSTEKKIGPICEGVYRAVKKRLIGEKLELKLLWKEEEEREMQAHECFIGKRQLIKCPSQIDLPQVNQHTIYAYVTYVESPSKFWIVDEHWNELYRELHDKINAGNLVKTSINLRKTYVGALVLAPYVDDGRIGYYRGRIETPVNGFGQYLISFIDYGNLEWISVKDLYEFPSSLDAQGWSSTPGMAIECRLSLLKPSTRSVWPTEVIEKFKKLTPPDALLKIDIHSVVKSVISGNLTSNDNYLPSLNINSLLLDNGFAEPAPEPYTALVNFDARQRQRSKLVSSEKKKLEIEDWKKRQIAEVVDRDLIPPPRATNTPCVLQGPFNPLQFYVESLCQISSSKPVTVDKHSVNCVILDHEPLAPTTQLLVAASMTTLEGSGKVVARQTTMMPATPGMLALMSLIFAPRAEMRYDQRLGRYTGALCGLGIDPDQEPIHMDHDLEVVFDTEIDDDDIDQINNIRNWLNIVLRKKQEENNALVHKDLCDALIKLIKKRREKVGQVFQEKPHAWKHLHPTYIKSEDSRHIQSLDTFLPHEVLFREKGIICPKNI